VLAALQQALRAKATTSSQSSTSSQMAHCADVLPTEVGDARSREGTVWLGPNRGRTSQSVWMSSETVLRLLARASRAISKHLGDSCSSGNAATSDLVPTIADVVIGDQSSGLSGRRGTLWSCDCVRAPRSRARHCRSASPVPECDHAPPRPGHGSSSSLCRQRAIYLSQGAQCLQGCAARDDPWRSP
jgi:hypothetical protein